MGQASGQDAGASPIQNRNRERARNVRQSLKASQVMNAALEKTLMSCPIHAGV